MVKKFILNYYPYLLFFLLIFGWFFRDLWPVEDMLSYNDRLPFAPSFQAGWPIFLNSWQEQFPGLLIPPYNLILLKEALLTALFFNNAVLAQKIDIVLPLLLSFVSMYWFLGKINLISKWARFIGSLVFAVNLVVLGEIAGGNSVSITAHAFWPPIFYFAYQLFFKGNNERRAILDVLYLALFSFLAFIFGDYVLLFIFGLVLLMGLINLHQKNIPWGRFFRNLLLFLAVFVLLSISYVVIYYDILKELRLLSKDYRFLINKSLLADVISSYAGFNFWSFISLGGGPFFEKIFGGRGWGYFTGIVPVLALLGVIFAPPKRRRFVWLILAVLTGIILFVLLTQSGALNFFYQKFPLLFRFRNAVRLQLLAGFCLATLVAFFWESLESRFGRRVWFFPLAFGLVVIYSVAIYPLSFGQVLKSEKTIPSYYQEINNLVKESRLKGFGRTLYLPWDFEVQKRIYWQDFYPNGLFINYGQYIENFYPDFLKELYSGFENRNIELLKSAFLTSKTGLIVIDKNRSSNNKGVISTGLVFMTPVVEGDSNQFQKLILETGLYQVYKETPDYVVLVSQKPFSQIDFFSDKEEFFPERLAGWFSLLASNNWGFQNALFNLKKPVETTTIEKEGLTSFSSENIIFVDDFRRGPRPDWWAMSGPYSSAKKFVMGGKEPAGLSSKLVFFPGTVFEIKLAVQNPPAYGFLGLRDKAENGLAFDLTRETNSGTPIIDMVGKNGNQSFRQTIGPQDDKEHAFKMEWWKDKIDFYFDGKKVGSFETSLEGSFPLYISAGKDQPLVLSQVSVSRLTQDTIWWQKKNSAPISGINWQIEEMGLNQYRLHIDKAPERFVFVFNHPYASGWQAEVGGQKLSHFPANGIFNGFELTNYQGGDIIISYQPQKTRNLVLILNGLSILTVLGTIFWLKRKTA